MAPLGGAMGEGKHRRRTGTGMNQHLDAARDGSGRAPGEPFSSDVQSQIGRQLRAIYDGVVAQPVPDRFLELLNELEQRSGRTDGDGSGKGIGSEPEDES